MKKKILGVLVLIAVVAVPFTKDISAEISNAFVSFKADETPTGPVDPTDPEKPGEGGTGSEGPLSIDYVPELAFGEQKVTGKVETYSTTNHKPYVQVTDKRGTGAGYSVSAELSEFTSEKEGVKPLSDAKLIFADGDLATIKSNTATAPTFKAGFDLSTTSGPVEIITAAKNQGMGTWLERWLGTEGSNNDKVKLQVNTANAMSAAYKGTINWTIGVTP